jgi:hypothetical protein
LPIHFYGKDFGSIVETVDKRGTTKAGTTKDRRQKGWEFERGCCGRKMGRKEQSWRRKRERGRETEREKACDGRSPRWRINRRGSQMGRQGNKRQQQITAHT